MGRTKVRKTSFSNCPKITASLSSDANYKMGTYHVRMDVEHPRHSTRMNGHYGNTSNAGWNHHVGFYSQQLEYHPSDNHPLRSHMRYFGQQVFQNGARTPNATPYKYTVTFLNNVRQHMYFERSDRNYGESIVQRRTESVQSNHTFANLLRCYGYHNNWLLFKFGYNYQKHPMYRGKHETWTQNVREPPKFFEREWVQEQQLDSDTPRQQLSYLLEQREQKKNDPTPESTGDFQDYDESFQSPVMENEENSDAETLSPNRVTSPLNNSFEATPMHTTNVSPTEDPLSMDIWCMFHANMQSETTFAKKMRLWKKLYNSFQQMASWLPKYELYLMGSTISGFGTDNSDMDMCIVDIDGPTYCDSRTEALNNLLRVKSFIESIPTASSFEHLDLIRAKVPILRFRNVQENIDIDLSINNRVGIRNTHLLHCYAQLDERVRPLVMVIKLWAQHHNLNNPIKSTMSSYSLVLMVINFLQYGVTPAVVPCLHKLYPEKFGQDNYNSNLLERIDPHESENKDSLGELLLKFYQYYAEFDYANYAISVRTGTILPISDCKWNGSEQFGITNYLFIEEPFNRTNTGKSVHDKYVFQQIKLAFAASWKMLEESESLSILFRKPLLASSSIPSPNSYF
ncbi:poly(A) RNA polymerase gld-2 homolog A-like [Anopheles marshallii]|uniref:poly(A) RNA polymerase gld-2 homolog A-like n=1 Tax=Anopheles marshallii TaxID=1521116 RepID=UPI00237B4B59|nr:poly(A) RNA polymerase gld-2 homolog A-like [Anopheles marshallii]